MCAYLHACIVTCMCMCVCMRACMNVDFCMCNSFVCICMRALGHACL